MDMRNLDPKRMAKVTAYLEEMEAKMPPELLAEARSVSRIDLLAASCDRAIDQLMTLFGLYGQAISRCGVCHDNDRQCGHCFAEMQVVEQLMQQAVSLALMAKVATGPGTRIAAEREREAEEKAKPQP